MRKTIFGRVLLSHFLIITICTVLLGILLFTFFGNYTVGEKKTMLREEVHHISELTVFFQDNQSNATASLYYMNINEIAERLGGVVIIIDKNGEIVAGSQNADRHITGKAEGVNIERLFAGEYTQLGSMGGFYRGTYLAVSAPIDYHGDTPAAVCIAVPMPHINRYRRDLSRMVLASVLVSMAVAYIMSYFISRQISKPLKRISLAAKGIAKGDFSAEVPVVGNDEIAELSETFNQMTYSLKKLEDMRDGFIAGVSHELRTPMTTISGFIEGILDNTIPPEKQTQYLTTVLGETKRLSRLVNELLLVARMEGGLELRRTRFDMNELIRVAILRFENVFTEKNIRADIVFDDDSCFVYADKDAIDRVMINLFDNALKFNRPEGYVRVSVQQTEGKATVSVENAGDGISAEDLKMIWDKFYKTDRSRGKDKSGVGLGLYLVKNILAAHGERIYAESVQGEYTRFTFTLPKK